MLIPSTLRQEWDGTNPCEDTVLSGASVAEPAAKILLPYDTRFEDATARTGERARPTLTTKILGFGTRLDATEIAEAQYAFQLDKETQARMLFRPAGTLLLPEKDIIGKDTLPHDATSIELTFDAMPVYEFIDFAWDFGQPVELWPQGELTQRDIDDGCRRPPHVVGSFAVYAVGGPQLGHIYAPWFISAKGRVGWGSLEDRGHGIIRLWLPIQWMKDLDPADWPVVKPGETFGLSDVGASQGQLWAGYMYATSMYSPASDGSATDMRIYIDGRVYVASILGVYSDSSGPLSLMASTGSSSEDLTNTWRIQTLLPAEDVQAAVSYWICASTDSVASKYNSVSNVARYSTFTGGNGTALQTPFGTTTTFDRRWSLYVTYTPGGGAAPADRRRELLHAHQHARGHR